MCTPSIAVHLSLRTGLASTVASGVLGALLLAVAVALSPAIHNGAIFHNLDGVYNLELIRQSNDWQPFGLGLSLDQVRGTGNIVIPVNTNLILMFRSQLALLGEVTPVASAVLAALLLYASTFALARALRFGAGTAIAAGWALGFSALPTFWYPLLYPIFAISPHVADIIAGASLLVAILLSIGRGGWTLDMLNAAVFVLIAFYLVVSNPLGVVMIGFAAAIYGIAAIATARSTRERTSKLLVCALAIAALLAAGVLPFLLGIAEYTATRFFWGEYARTQLTTQFASIFFHDAPFSILGRVAIVMSVVEAAWQAFSGDHSARRMAIGHLIGTTLVVFGGWLVVTQVSDWLGPSTLYFEFSMWPFYAIYAMGLISRFAWPLWSHVPKVGVLLTAASRASGAMLVAITLIPIAFAAVILQSRSGEVTTSFSPYPPRTTAFGELMLGEIGLKPGGPFRGRLATLTGVAGTSRVIWGDLHGYDAELYAAVGSELRLIGPWYYDIPTLQEYSQIITPTQFLLQSRFLARPGDRQVRNISLFTRPDSDLLRAWGVRYVVADIDVPGARQLATLRWDRRKPPIHLFELPAPNIGTYSPYIVTQVDDFAGAMGFLVRKPDLRRNVALFEALDGPLHEATATIEAHPGVVKVLVDSPGRALVLLPYEYTACTKAVVLKGDPTVRLLRANVAQSALLVQGKATVDLVTRYGVPFDTGCRRADAAEAKRLGITGAARQYPPGVGR